MMASAIKKVSMTYVPRNSMTYVPRNTPLCLFLSRRDWSKLLTIDNKCRGPVLSFTTLPRRNIRRDPPRLIAWPVHFRDRERFFFFAGIVARAASTSSAARGSAGVAVACASAEGMAFASDPAGGLMSYGIDLTDVYRQVGIYAARVINGAKPPTCQLWSQPSLSS
jgi:hypothetical protein